MNLSVNNLTAKLIISSTDWLSSRVLDNPYMFNYVRYLLAGRQKNIKTFIKNNLDRYQCKSIADICSGTGDFAELIPKDAYYVGWDINEDFINYARKRYRGDRSKSFIKVDILNAKETINENFDAVMLISTLHHFSDDELNTLLPFVKKIARKVIIIADIIPDPPHILQKIFAKIDRGKFVRPKDEKIKILKKYFKVRHIQEIPTRSAVQLGIICEV
jgi:SAM-dependent methyltransferase